MTALLGSTLSRHGSIQHTEKQLEHPPTLPQRADPTSSDAKILGPFSKRREVNIRRRFFKSETAKVQPPIELFRVHVLQASTSPDKLAKPDAIEPKAESAKQPSPPPIVGFQGTSVFRDLEAIASPNLDIQKRVVGSALPIPPSSITSVHIRTSTPTTKVNRFIRRQHQKILARIPILTYLEHPNDPIGKYQVSLSPLAHLGSSSNKLSSAVAMADEADLAWLRLPPLPTKPNISPRRRLAGEGIKTIESIGHPSTSQIG